MRARILWIAVAEGRGHLMRAFLARRVLAEVGIDVELATTRPQGQRFLAALGAPSLLMPGGPAGLAYDGLQNLDRAKSSRAILARLPKAAWADLGWLAQRSARWSLVVDDAFHPSLVVAPWVLSSRSVPVVHVYAENLLSAIGGPAFELLARRAFATVELTLGGAPSRATLTLPPLVRMPSVMGGSATAAVYLNAYFDDPSLAAAIEGALARRGLAPHLVGEGYRQRAGWVAMDPDFADRLGRARVLIAAPGLATSTQVTQLGVPYLALLSEQPEQRANYARLERVASGPIAAVDVSPSQDLGSRIDRALSHVLSAPRGAARAYDPAPLWRSTWSELVGAADRHRARLEGRRRCKATSPRWP